MSQRQCGRRHFGSRIYCEACFQVRAETGKTLSLDSGHQARDGAALLSALDAPLGTIVRTSRTSTFTRGGDRAAAVPGAYCSVGYSGQPWWPLRAYTAATAGQKAIRTAAGDALITATGRVYGSRCGGAAGAVGAGGAYEAEAREAGVYEHGPRRGELPAPSVAFGGPFVMASGHADGATPARFYWSAACLIRASKQPDRDVRKQTRLQAAANDGGDSEESDDSADDSGDTAISHITATKSADG